MDGGSRDPNAGRDKALAGRQASMDGKPGPEGRATITPVARLRGLLAERGHGDGLPAEDDPTRVDAGLVLAVGDAERRDHLVARAFQAHVVAEEVAARHRRVQEVERLRG